MSTTLEDFVNARSATLLSWHRRIDPADPLRVQDDSVAARHLTLSAVATSTASLANGDADPSVTFSGTQHASRDVYSVLADGWTIALRVRPTAVTAGAVVAYNGSSSTNGYGLCVSGGRWSALLGGKQFCQAGAGSAVAGTTYTIVVTREGGTLKMYVNGVATTITNYQVANSNTITTAPATPTGKYAIGGDAIGNSSYFSGTVDEVVFDGVAWSAATASEFHAIVGAIVLPGAPTIAGVQVGTAVTVTVPSAVSAGTNATTGYRLYEDGAIVQTATTLAFPLSFAARTVSAGQRKVYVATAIDGSANESDDSNSLAYATTGLTNTGTTYATTFAARYDTTGQTLAYTVYDPIGAVLASGTCVEVTPGVYVADPAIYHSWRGTVVIAGPTGESEHVEAFDGITRSDLQTIKGQAVTAAAPVTFPESVASQVTSAAIAAVLAGITSLANWMRAGFRKSAADVPALLEINASGGTYDPTTDSHEATREAVDALAVATTDPALVLTGTAQAGGVSSITLAAGASATNDLYVRQTLQIVSGPGAGQARTIIAYNGTTKVATLDGPQLVTLPTNASVYRIRATPGNRVNASQQTVAQSSVPTTANGAGNAPAARNFSVVRLYRWVQTITFQLPSYAPPGGYAEYVFTLKSSTADADNLAVVVLSDTDGLVTSLGVPALDATLGALTIDVVGDTVTATWELQAAAMGMTANPGYAWDIGGYAEDAPDHKDILAGGVVNVAEAVRRAVVRP